MSFENASFAKSLYVSGTPRKQQQQQQQAHGSPNTSTPGRPSHQANNLNFSTPNKAILTPIFSTPSTSFSISNISGISNNSPLAGRGPGGKIINSTATASSQNPAVSPLHEHPADSPNFDRTFTGNASLLGVYSSTPNKPPSSSSWESPSGSVSSPPITPASKTLGNKGDQYYTAGSPSLSATAALLAAEGSLTSTPNAAKPPKPTSVPTGSWEHPSLAVIRNRTINKSQVLRTVFINVIGLILFNLILHSARSVSAIPESIATELAKFSHIGFYIVTALQCLFAFNITWNTYKLVKPQDTFDDLPLTPSQRKLMGLPDSPTAKVPQNPASPPRYLKSSAQTRYSPGPSVQTSPLSTSSPISGAAARSSPFNSKPSNVVLTATPSKNTPASLVPESPLAGLSRKLNSPVKEQLRQQQPVLPQSPSVIASSTPIRPSTVSRLSTNSILKPNSPGTSTPISIAKPDSIQSPSTPSTSTSVSFTPSGRYRYMAESPNRHRSFRNI